MKIPPPTNAPATRPAPETNKPIARQHSATTVETGDPDESGALGSNTGRDFASVLEEVSRPRRREDGESDGEERDSPNSERTDSELETRRREERHAGGDDARGGGFDGRGAMREIGAAHEAASARAILHIADLERIVSAVRTQTLASGRREVTIELRRSVLEGLRVKLSADNNGRITAEFIAASERLRGQLDARASELAGLLRSRGVNLASLRTSVGADASAQHESRHSGQHDFSAPATRSMTAPAASTSSSATANEANDTPQGDETSYRA